MLAGTCTACGEPSEQPDFLAGQTVRCKRCHNGWVNLPARAGESKLAAVPPPSPPAVVPVPKSPPTPRDVRPPSPLPVHEPAPPRAERVRREPGVWETYVLSRYLPLNLAVLAGLIGGLKSCFALVTDGAVEFGPGAVAVVFVTAAIWGLGVGLVAVVITLITGMSPGRSRPSDEDRPTL